MRTMTVRMLHRPDADHRAAAPARGLGRVRHALQPASPAPGPESAATRQRRHRHRRGYRPGCGADTVPQGPRRADPRVRTSSMTAARPAITLQRPRQGLWNPTGLVSIPKLPGISQDGSCSSRCAVTRKRSSPRPTCRRSRMEATPTPGRQGVLHRADVREVDLGNGVVIPVLPPSARVVE